MSFRRRHVKNTHTSTRAAAAADDDDGGKYIPLRRIQTVCACGFVSVCVCVIVCVNVCVHGIVW